MVKYYKCFNCKHRAEITPCSRCCDGSNFLPESPKRPYVVSYDSVIKRYRSGQPVIQKVVFNDPATIVFWDDGTKTVVKRAVEYDDFDPEKGLAMAICKKMLGDGYYRMMKKYTDLYVEPPKPPHLDDTVVPSVVFEGLEERLRKMINDIGSFNG